jgi:hypothetical protein
MLEAGADVLHRGGGEGHPVEGRLVDLHKMVRLRCGAGTAAQLTNDTRSAMGRLRQRGFQQQVPQHSS